MATTSFVWADLAEIVWTPFAPASVPLGIRALQENVPFVEMMVLQRSSFGALATPVLYAIFSTEPGVKPWPLILTRAPLGPLVGVIVMLGPVTVIEVEADAITDEEALIVVCPVATPVRSPVGETVAMEESADAQVICPVTSRVDPSE